MMRAKQFGNRIERCVELCRLFVLCDLKNFHLKNFIPAALVPY